MRQHCWIGTCLLIVLGGCQRTLYDWGTYEASVFKMYSSREDFSSGKETDRLQREVDSTQRKNRALPPGKMAHLGYLYLLQGDSERARYCFETEKQLFPESTKFMDFLLTRLR